MVLERELRKDKPKEGRLANPDCWGLVGGVLLAAEAAGAAGTAEPEPEEAPEEAPDEAPDEPSDCSPCCCEACGSTA